MGRTLCRGTQVPGTRARHGPYGWFGRWSVLPDSRQGYGFGRPHDTAPHRKDMHMYIGIGGLILLILILILIF